MVEIIKGRFTSIEMMPLPLPRNALPARKKGISITLSHVDSMKFRFGRGDGVRFFSRARYGRVGR